MVELATVFWFSQNYAPVRNTERFKTLCGMRGWSITGTRGWPDLCRPMGADDFVCD
jgi:hypothetical protein